MDYASILGIDYVLPPEKVTNEDLSREFPEWSMKKISAKTGIKERRIVSTECASDLATSAAEKLFCEHPEWKEQTEAIIFCTQTPDYFLPASACLIQQRLELPHSVAAVDINQGCSGYIYSLGLAKGMVETGQAQSVLLLNADTYTRLIHPSDKSARTLFGDAGCATFVSTATGGSESESLGPFCYGTDGAGAENLMVPAGGFRTPSDDSTAIETTDANGNCRTQQNLSMNGAEVFAFALKRVPQLVAQMLDKAQCSADDIEHFVFHQANQYMLETLRKKCKIPAEKFLICLENTGNTVSASIPIALCKLQQQGKLKTGDRIMLVGFGVGYSWGATLVRWTGSDGT